MDSSARHETSSSASASSPSSSDSSNTPSLSSSSSPLSVLSKSPSLSPAAPAAMHVASRYPSPSSTATQSERASPPQLPDSGEIQVRTDDPPSAKRRKMAGPNVRTTQYLDLDNREDATDLQLDRLLWALRRKKKIVVVAGAGISVAAGIPDFRSSHGLFNTLKDKHKIKGGGKSLFDASVYKNDKSTAEFHKMVRDLSRLTKEAKPTAFHHMLATIAQEGRLMRLYSQNVDCLDTSLKPLATNIPLNTKAPWPVTIQLHGGLEKMQCTKCSHVDNFDGTRFQGPEPPLCLSCVEDDRVRTEFAGKRSHGIGRLRPRMVLYNEYNPDEDAIGKVSQADLRRIPDAVIVVGTSLKVPGVRRIVRELCQATRSKRDGFTAWLNLDPVPQTPDMKDLWDLVVRGKCDDIAGLLNLPPWNCDTQDIGYMDEYMVSGSTEKEVEFERRRSRDRIDVLLASRTQPLEQSGDVESKTGGIFAIKSKMLDKTHNKVHNPPPTPIASPRQGMPQARKPLPGGRTRQKTLGFGAQMTKFKDATYKTAKFMKPTKVRHPSQHVKIKNDITKTFKTTKSVTKVVQTAKEPIEQTRCYAEFPETPPTLRNKRDLTHALPSFRPGAGRSDKISYQPADASSGGLGFISPPGDLEIREVKQSIIPNPKPLAVTQLSD